MLTIDRRRFALPTNQFRDEVTAKDLIVLHFTAGLSAQSAYWSWTATSDRVATSYVVDPDGSIYEFFDPSRWAHHLGVPGAANPNFLHDRRSIGIEIANPGGLKLDKQNPRQLNWWPANYTTRWCTLEENAKYIRRSYRGLDYFAAFPEPQFQSVCGLVNMLCDAFRIPRNVPSPYCRDRYDLAAYAPFKGIASHQNFHPEKTDIGPAWDWPRFIDAIRAVE